MTYPNLLIIGAPKCGTSSLFKWLSDHPGIAGAKLKETHFFDDPGTHRFDPKNNFLTSGIGAYERYFPDTTGEKTRWVLEATPSYLYSENALKNITALPERPKIIIILREPSDQIYSLYQYFKNNWQYINPKMYFCEFIEAVREGKHEFRGNELLENCLEYVKYHLYIERWLMLYGRENILVCHYEDLKENPKLFIENICNFLKIDSEFYNGYKFESENVTYRVRFHFLQKLNVLIRAAVPKGKLYELLRDLYRKFNTENKHEGIKATDDVAKLSLRSAYADYKQKIDRILKG